MADGFAGLNLVGHSASFQAALRLIERIARCDATVLIQGETGTGKELAGRAIHYLGARRGAPFIAVNCGAIPEQLVESELFGHARGAFTDAREAREGVIAQAEGGTLFLDEVDSLGARSQVALLRFLQDREYRPVGGQAMRRADLRVIAATNADLAAMAGRREYRQDLLFRLDVLALRLPPLRERPGDAALLADLFVRRLSEQYRGAPRALDPGLRASLGDRPWPGNVRELENFIHRAFLLSDGPVIGAAEDGQDEASEVQSGGLPFHAAKAAAIEGFERRYLVDLLTRTRGNVSEAARLSGKERSRLGRLLKKHGLARDAFLGAEGA
ncbi:sigma 54-interacting transcriptional regulator [Falsiroseomonas sp. HW251]|uniref:sigma 54-interacting transcriptional regulator n=1 Tax=Falsiroseomonas sp. HW251 TaxID=3390998 RepID=UPI003D31FCDB